MKSTTKTDDRAMTLAECGAKIGVSAKTVKGWIDGGHLAAFIRPGATIGSKTRGPKSLRVQPEDWDRFIRAQTMTGRPAAEIAATPAPAPAVKGSPVGSDGRRRGSRPRVGK